MKYTYDLYIPDINMPGGTRRVDTTTRLEDFASTPLDLNGFIKVTDNSTNKEVTKIRTPDDYHAWLSQEDHRTSIRNQHVDEPLRSVVNRIAQTNAFTRPNDKWDPFDKKETDINMKKESDGFFGEPLKAAAELFNITPKETIDAANPPHYQNFVEFELEGWGPLKLQWLEIEFRKPQFRNNPEAIKGALLFQIDKYLGRMGGKDSTIQELKKAKWYLEYLIAFESNGNNPLFVKDIKHWNNNEKEKV